MFVYKTQAEIEDLSEYQLEKYLDEKRQHELKEAKDAAENAAREAAQKLINEAAEKAEEKTNAAIEAAVKVVKDEYDTKLEQAQAAMNRAKEKELSNRGVNEFQKEIEDAFALPENEAQFKSVATSKKLDINFESKAILVPTGGVAPQFVPIVGPGHDAFHARNAIRVFPTTSNMISYVQMTIDATKAGIGGVGQGEQKPPISWVPTPKTAPVVKIAGLVDVADEFLDDVVGSRSFLAYELVQEYYDAEDLQIFKADGTTNNLLGLWYQAANQTFNQGGVGANSNNIEKVAAGITEVRKLKRVVNAAYVSPVAWQDMLLNKDKQDAYTYPITFGVDNVLRIGDVPVYWSNVFADNEGLVGDFARGTAIFQRKAMNVGYFDQNKDNVEKNIVTIRIEGREALPIYYPEAFKKLLLGQTT